jgi:hypothetical protein
LRIAEYAEGVKEVAARALELAPARSGIYFAERVRHGATAAEGNAQIVDAIHIPGASHLFGALEDAVHPNLEPYTSSGLVGGQ